MEYKPLRAELYYQYCKPGNDCKACFMFWFVGIESGDISALKQFVQNIEDSLLFMTQMVIAEGWGVVRNHIKHYRWTSLLCKFHSENDLCIKVRSLRSPFLLKI